MKDKEVKEVTLEEIAEYKEKTGKELPMVPVVDIFYQVNYLTRLNYIRDYIWFGEEYVQPKKETKRSALFD